MPPRTNWDWARMFKKTKRREANDSRVLHGVWPWIVWRIYICNVVKSKIIFALHSFAQKCVSGHHFFHFCTNIARCCVVAKIYILSARWSTDSWQRRKWGWKQLRTSLSLSSLAGQQRAGHCHLCGDSRTVGPVSRSGHKLHLSTCSCFHLPPPKVGSGHWPDIAYQCPCHCSHFKVSQHKMSSFISL